MQRSAYYSEHLKSWVRMECQEDGEWCHTSGFGSQNAALNFNALGFQDRSATKKPLFGASGLPSFLEELPDSKSDSAVASSKKSSGRRK